jgi:uncharacterized protein (TIGR01777 family)
MKIVIPGGTGQVGTVLARAFASEGHEVVVLTRRPRPEARWRTVAWDGETAGEWIREVDGADALINLAGRSVNCRYTAANRHEILESRVRSTRAVGEAIARSARPPRVWLQASTATIYAHRYDAANDERAGTIGGGEPDAPEAWRFSIDVARAWEGAWREARVGATRRVALRSAVTMSPDPGGPFDVLLGLVRCGLGGAAGDGRQFVSWVHHEDFVRAVAWLIDRDDIEGVVNVAAPEPLPNAEFMRVLRRAWGAPIGVPARGWILDLGAALMRTETELVLKSRRVVPGRLLDAGFEFRYATWDAAARNLVASCRA